MPGVKYDSPFPVEKELYRIDTAYRLSGGFNIAEGELQKLAGQSHIPVLCPIVVDLAARTFKVVQNSKVYEAAEASATSLKIAKGSFVQVNDVLLVAKGQSVTVSAIDKSKADYDALTVSSLPVALAAGAILSKAKLVKLSAVAVADAAAEATSIKIAKGSNITGACTLSDGTNSITVTAIDKSAADCDTLTVSSLAAKVDAGTVLEAATASVPVAEHVANFANYDRRKIADNMSITAIAQAYEIDEANLDIPFTEEDKAGVTDRFMFI